MEGLLAFFLESTFIGLWIFGWDKLKPRVHLATIWLAAIGTNISAFFILAANSWMQHPVGFRYNPARHRAELIDIWAVLGNSTLMAALPHVLFGGFMTAGVFLIGVAAWHLARRNEVNVFRPAMRLGLVVCLLAAIGTTFTGHWQSVLMTRQQPMKMAAAEALYDTATPASFSLFTIGTLDGRHEVWSVRVPKLLSLLANADPNSTVEGINDIQRQYEAQRGPGDYVPNVPVAYWSFRLMIGFGALAALLALAGLWLTRRGRVPDGRWFCRAALASMALPFLANSTGWIFTEMARQPWAVFGVLKTEAGVSPSVPLSSVATSLTVYTLLYAALAGIWGALMVRHVKAGPPAEFEVSEPGEPLPTFSY